jgi:hypothetical protein
MLIALKKNIDMTRKNKKNLPIDKTMKIMSPLHPRPLNNCVKFGSNGHAIRNESPLHQVCQYRERKNKK